MPAKSPNDPKGARRLLAAEKRKRAVELRLQGHTYREIARMIGVKLAHAQRLVDQAVGEKQAEFTDLVRQHSLMQTERVYAMIRGLYARATTGDVDAVAAMLRCEERLARLHGLDAPAKVQTEVELRQLPQDELVALAARVGLSVVMLPGSDGPLPLPLGPGPVIVDAIPDPPDPDLPAG